MFGSGYFVGLAIERYQQKKVALAGVLLIAGGWALLRFAVLSGWSETAVGFSLFIVGCGGITSLMAMLTWQQLNYSSKHRGKVTALLLAAYCIAGAIWSPLYESFYPDDLPGYCVFISSVALVAGAFVVFTTGSAWSPNVPAVSNVQTLGKELELVRSSASAHSESSISSSSSLTSKEVKKEKEDFIIDEYGHLRGANGKPKEADVESLHVISFPSAPPKVLPVLFCLSRYSVFFWLEYLPVFVILGTAFALVNNTALMVDALNTVHDPNTPNVRDVDGSQLIQTIVIVFDVFNAGSRVLGGWMTDILASYGKSRIWVLILASILCIIGSISVAYATISNILVGNIIIGLADGLCFAVWPVMTREVFGKSRYGRFYGLLNTAVAAGSLAFNAMASTMYHNAGFSLLGTDGVVRFVCSGTICFQQTFITCAILCLFFAFIPSCILLWWLNKPENMPGGKPPVKTVESVQEAFEKALIMTDQIEIDSDLIHQDEVARQAEDLGFDDLFSTISGSTTNSSNAAPSSNTIATDISKNTATARSA
jgi:MFS family permease